MSRKQDAMELTLNAKTPRDVLLRQLKKLLKGLIDCKDRRISQGLNDIALKLMTSQVRFHKSMEVRLNAACCISELLRLSSPEPPYNEKQLKHIFDLFFDQLQGLTDITSPQFSRRFHLLESIKESNVCSLLNTHIEGVEYITKLFRLVSKVFENEGEVKVTKVIENHFADILAEVVSESISEPKIMDELLSPLLATSKESNKHMYELMLKVLKRCEENVETPIVAFFQNGFIRGADENSKINDTEEQLEVLQEICIKCPQLVTSLVPSLATMLEAEEEEERLEMVEFFGNVLTADVDYPDHPTYKHFWGTFTQRLGDVSPTVRQTCLTYCKDLFIKHDEYKDELSEILMDRVCDSDAAVRQAAVEAVCNALVLRPDLFHEALLNAVGKRGMDKQKMVRDVTFKGLSKLFATHCSPYWKEGKPLPAMSRPFSWIPRQLLGTVPSAPHVVSTLDYCIDQIILGGTKNTLEERAKLFVGIYASLSPAKSVEGFKMLISQKAVWHKGMLELIESQYVLEETSDKSRREILKNIHKTQARNFIVRLKIFPEQHLEKALSFLLSILENKNKKLRAHLADLCDPSLSYQRIVDAREEFSQAARLALKSGLPKKGRASTGANEFGTILARRLASTVINAAVIPLFVKDIQNNLNKRIRLCIPVLNMMSTITRIYPQLGKQLQKDLMPLLVREEPNIVNPVLDCLCIPEPKNMLIMKVRKRVKRVRATASQVSQNKRKLRSKKSNVTNLQSMDYSQDFGRSPSPEDSQEGYEKAQESLMESEEDAQVPVFDLNQKKVLLESLQALFFSDHEGQSQLAMRALHQHLQSMPGLDDIFARLIDTHIKLDHPLSGSEEQAPETVSVVGSIPPESNLSDEKEGVSTRECYSYRLQGIAEIALISLKALPYGFAIGLIDECFLENTESMLIIQEAALEVLVNHLLCLAQTQAARREQDVRDDEEQEEAAQKKYPVNNTDIMTYAFPLMAFLLKIIRNGGSVTPGDDNEDDDREYVRNRLLLLVGQALMKLYNERLYRTLLSPYPSRAQQGGEQKGSYALKHVIMLAHHDDDQVRREFLDYILKLVLQQRLRFGFISLLAYSASDSGANLKERSSEMSRLITRQRMIVAKARRAPGFNTIQAAKLASQLPEHAVADLIYFLSYHEDFGHIDLEVCDYFQKFLKMFLEALFADKSQQNNLHMVLNITQAIRNSQDVRNPNNTNIYVLAEMTQVIAASLIKSNLPESATRENVRLPADMYKPRAKHLRTRFIPEGFQITGATFHSNKPHVGRGGQVAGSEKPSHAKQPNLQFTPTSDEDENENEGKSKAKAGAKRKGKKKRDRGGHKGGKLKSKSKTAKKRGKQAKAEQVVLRERIPRNAKKDVRYTEASGEDSDSEADMVEYSSPSQQSPKVSSPVPSDTSFSPSFDFDEENDLNQVASSGESRGKRSREASDRSEEVSRVRKKTKVELLSHKADKKKASRAKFKLAKKKTQPKVISSPSRSPYRSPVQQRRTRSADLKEMETEDSDDFADPSSSIPLRQPRIGDHSHSESESESECGQADLQTESQASGFEDEDHMMSEDSALDAMMAMSPPEPASQYEMSQLDIEALQEGLPQVSFRKMRGMRR